MRRITLVGAGPVGSLLALTLARRGYEVEVYERRADMRVATTDRGRSINLALSTRGIHALHAVGLEKDVLRHAVPMLGRMMHSPAGKLTFQRYGKDDSEYINSMSRGGLNALLMTRAEETGRVRIHFNQRALGMDLETGALRIRDERTQAERDIATELVIGTDGSSSVIRARMSELSEFRSEESPLDYGYKELTLPAGPEGAHLIDRNALHIWPRGTFMLIALPNEDGSFTCTLFLPYKGAPSFVGLHEPVQVEEFFKKHFPDVVPLLPGLSETFSENPTGHMVTLKCAPWHVRDRVLLLGDAAHAIVPFFGQGMNAGFEDVTILGELLDQHRDDWPKVISEFSARRKPDADAIADLALDNFIEMRDRVADQRFLLEKQIEQRLSREFPAEYRSRYSLVTFSRIPYRVAHQAGVIQNGILSLLSEGLSTPEKVDLQLAGKLIRERLAPVLSPYLS